MFNFFFIFFSKPIYRSYIVYSSSDMFINGFDSEYLHLVFQKMASRMVISSAIVFFAFMAMAVVSLMWWFTDYSYVLGSAGMA